MCARAHKRMHAHTKKNGFSSLEQSWGGRPQIIKLWTLPGLLPKGDPSALPLSVSPVSVMLGQNQNFLLNFN